ncbi:MAG TPA: ribulose-phosphate 3-epimerase [Patescibacteria group bacterium]|nr:ribulose-phosphate 3-epimerase [Patescibacteria group bacterium]
MITEIVPAILSYDAADAQRKLKIVEPYVHRVQMDVMDGAFVKNTTLSVADYGQIKTSLKREVQLMVSEPEKYIDDCVKYGMDLVEIHIESQKNIWTTIQKAKNANLKVGIAINPETPAERVRQYLQSADLVLLMSVHPGLGGQVFIPETLQKIKLLRAMWPSGIIEVDGGLKKGIVGKCAKAGANFMVVGTGIFNAADPLQALHDLRAEITHPEQQQIVEDA